MRTHCRLWAVCEPAIAITTTYGIRCGDIGSNILLRLFQAGRLILSRFPRAPSGFRKQLFGRAFSTFSECAKSSGNCECAGAAGELLENVISLIPGACHACGSYNPSAALRPLTTWARQQQCRYCNLRNTNVLFSRLNDPLLLLMLI